jgi:hypothetical protein
MLSQHPSKLLLQFGSSQRNINLNFPVYQSNAVGHSFVVVASKMWNDLPHAITLNTIVKTENSLSLRYCLTINTHTYTDSFEYELTVFTEHIHL